MGDVPQGQYATKQKIGPDQFQSELTVDGKTVWVVEDRVNASSTGTGTGGNADSLGLQGLAIPAALAKKYNIPAGKTILYNSGSSLTPPAAPTTGAHLYEAIQQMTGVPKAFKMALTNQIFGVGFNPTSREATTFLDKLTTKLAANDFSLTGLTPSGIVTPQAPLSRATVVGLNQQASEFQQSERLGEEGLLASEHATTLGLSEATASQENSAFGTVAQDLDNWHLGALAPYVLQMILRNGDHVTNTDAILAAVRGDAPSGLGPRVDDIMRHEYDTAFPGLRAYNAQNGIHYTESQYQTYSSAIKDAAAQYGGVSVTQAEVGKLLTGHVSAPEFTQRVQDIGAAVINADSGTKALLQSQYGINNADLFNYYANGKNSLPSMQRKVASAEIQDYGNRIGLGALGQAQGEQLGDMAKLAATQGNNGLGYGVSQIESSLLTASRDAALLKSNPGAGTPNVTTGQLIGSQLPGFDGTNQLAAQIAVGRAEGARAAPFDKGGGYAEDAKGVVGVGSAAT